MRMKLYTLLCISFFLLFTACNQDDDPVPPEVGSRTVLVYIVADNNLSSFAKEDVEEMIAGMESVDLSSSNLLVYQDDRVAPVLFRISRNKKGRLEKEIIKEYAEQVSTKASVMKEVMHRAFYEYPADSYGLADGWIPYPVPSIGILQIKITPCSKECFQWKEQTALRIISPFRLIPKLLRLTVPWLGIKLRDSKIWAGSM